MDFGLVEAHSCSQGSVAAELEDKHAFRCYQFVFE